MDTYATRKNFIFEKRITDITERIRQARMMDIFVPHALFDARQQGMLSKEQKDTQDKQAMVTFDSLKSAYGLLWPMVIAGYVISMLVFVLELRHPTHSPAVISL